MSAPKQRRYFLQFLFALGSIIFLCLFSTCTRQRKLSAMDWPVVTRTSRPWTRWWWMGSAVDKTNLTSLLEQYSKAGIGGVEITPIYGVKGYEDRFINYLSPKWMEVLDYTVREAERIGVGVDMPTGTAWPFGGPQVGVKDEDIRVILKTYKLDAGSSLGKPLKHPKGTFKELIAYSDDGTMVNLTEKVDEDGVLDWVAPAGEWELYAVFQGWSSKQVNSAAPGGEGHAISPFSYISLKNYLKRFDDVFAGYKGRPVRSFFHDSYEYNGNWTNDMFEQFEARRGYDLRRYLSALENKGPEDFVARVNCDYRETISELLLEKFITPWVNWCHQKGSIARNQAHGSPGNIIDLYAAVDIPETETFGSSRFDIPGLRRDSELCGDIPDPLMFKFASSGAHLTGKKLISSESCTWLGEHFKVSLSQIKPEIDQLLVGGINHIFYHGSTYSPVGEQWPGWLFFASTHFDPINSLWRDFPELNAYIARCQSFLQDGRPDDDVLVYFPVYDLWHHKARYKWRMRGFRRLFPLQVHNIGNWFYGSTFHNVAKFLQDKGYTFDYISDRLLTEAKVSSGDIQMADVKYRVVVIPKTRFIPLGTLEKLVGMAKAGATVIVHGDLPADVPGWGDLENRRRLFRDILLEIKPQDSRYPRISQANIGKGRFLIGENLEQMLELADIAREPIVDTDGIRLIRRMHPEGRHYFITNLGRHNIDGWITLGVTAKSVIIFDPLSDRCGLAAVQETKTGTTQVYLQLHPGQSCILRTFSSRKIVGPKWTYLEPTGEPYKIKGTWKVSFIEGGPKLPVDFKTKTLASWIQQEDTEAKRFAGTARYEIVFDVPSFEADDWVLDLGRVCESARVRLNGNNVGTLFSIPFKIAVGRFLRKGKNTLEVEVTNLSANRIADMDRRKVYWKKFYRTNFVNLRYEQFDASNWPPMDSGLLGPVHLVPSKLIEHSVK